MEKHGIDISKHQGKPDWTKLAAEHKAGRLDFVIMRAGYGGGTIDPEFEANYAAARAAGIPVGAYWYAYWKNYTPAQEARSRSYSRRLFIMSVDAYSPTYRPDAASAASPSSVLSVRAALLSARIFGSYSTSYQMPYSSTLPATVRKKPAASWAGV